MKLRCKLKLHKWFYYNKWHYHDKDMRGCSLCGRHEERAGYYLYGDWYEVKNHMRFLEIVLRRLGIYGRRHK